ncbi:MAG TPA: hypothetical protein VFV75_01755 [Candidatus Polarisedimenticolaceae bacterium]|nr:hypothetical protein [Candidatus Polarisedimenticolaceae bacterium]
MNVRHVFPALCVLLLAGSLHACKSEKPGEEPPPTAPTGQTDASSPTPAQTPAAAAPPLATGHGPETAALPEGHPPIAGAAPADTGAALPAGHPPIAGGPQVQAPDPMSGRGTSGIVWKTPAGWVEETPSSNLRRGQYRVPGKGGDAELAIFYFGAGQGGDPTANAQRWASQFKQPGGGDPLEAMKTQTLDMKGTKVLLVETAGTYVNTAMNPADVGEKPNYALLGAVVPGPDANWFFKLTGPQATVKEQRDRFLQLLQSIQKGA